MLVRMAAMAALAMLSAVNVAHAQRSTPVSVVNGDGDPVPVTGMVLVQEKKIPIYCPDTLLTVNTIDTLDCVRTDTGETFSVVPDDYRLAITNIVMDTNGNLVPGLASEDVSAKLRIGRIRAGTITFPDVRISVFRFVETKVFTAETPFVLLGEGMSLGAWNIDPRNTARAVDLTLQGYLEPFSPPTDVSGPGDLTGR